MSTLNARPVLEDIARVFPATLELSTIGVVIGVVLGVPLGVASAVRQGSWIDQIARVVALVGYSMPIFWLGLMGLLVFYGILGWVNGPGRIGIFYDGIVPTRTGLLLVDAAIAGQWDAWRSAFGHIILPASILGYFSLAYISRMTRSFMLEQLSSEYVTTARVKGMSERQVVWGHAFRNIRVQLITVIALSYANLLEGSVLTEIIFSWPGIGSYITTALLAADMNAVLGGTVVVGLIFICLNIFSDLLYRILDPRSK
jgi:peptide/nickel transport system permease protein